MKNLYIFALIIWISIVGNRSQSCDVGFEYNDTSNLCEDIDECTANVASPCKDNPLRPMCVNTDGSYRCMCRRRGPNFTYGPECNSTDPAADLICADNKDGCYNNGTCENFETCHCNEGFLGKYCELMMASDCPNMCWNNGTCVRNNRTSKPYCTCQTGYRGDMCQYKMNLCNQTENVCLNDGTCMPGVYPPCDCKPMYAGNFCENVDMFNITCQECQENSTLTVNGSCEMDDTYNTCPCKHGFYGTFCQYSMRTCQNGGLDIPIPPPIYSRCICPEGVSGSSCETDIINECDNAMCQNGADCMDMPGYYMCNCTYGWMGQYCEQRDPNVVMPTTPRPSTCLNSSFCPLGQEPWMNCSNYMSCQQNFMDKKCDVECATENCLYDGFDCVVGLIRTCPNITCSLLYGNGVCDAECDIPECHNDGNDCLKKNETSMYFLGTIILDVTIANLSELLENVSTEFLYLARVFPFNLTSNYPATIVPRRRGSNEKTDIPYIMPMNTSMGQMFYRGYYDVFNEAGCNETCWSSIQSFVNYFAASESVQMNNNYRLLAVGACMEGYYGENCIMKCSSNCKTMDDTPVCDMSDGRCTLGCMNTSYVGSKCDAMCSGNCLASVCNNDGTCNMTTNGRCKAGYMGERCDQICAVGKYDIDCGKSCHSMCTASCNSMTGYCQCKDGYTFNGMCIACMDGKYGTNCTRMCNKNCNNAMCNKTNGMCNKPCSKGFTGDMCDQACSEGYYGADCAMECSANCANKRCHFENGNCESCKEGYTGDKCQNTAPNNNTVKQDSSATVIAVIVVLVILLLVALVIAYILWRRSQGGQYETAEMEQKGLVLNNMETKTNNEYVEMQNAAMVNETENKNTEKAPLIGQGKQFETIDLSATTDENGGNLAAGGVFDGGPADAPKQSEPTLEEAETKDSAAKPEEAAETKDSAATEPKEDKDTENVKTDNTEPVPPPVENADTDGTPVENTNAEKAHDETNKTPEDSAQEGKPTHKPVEATLSTMSLPPPPVQEEGGDKIRESLDVDSIPPPTEESAPKNNAAETETSKSDVDNIPPPTEESASKNNAAETETSKSDEKVGEETKTEEQTKNETASEDNKESTETSNDTENT